MARIINKLANKDISLVDSMISLGSCTMKLNSSYTLNFMSHKKVANIHPYMAHLQKGYIEMINDLENMFKNYLGFERVSF